MRATASNVSNASIAVSSAPPPELSSAGGGGVGVGVGVVAVTVTPTTELVVLPPVPLQVSEKSLFIVNTALCSEPVVLLLPAHAPFATQLLALVELQVNVVRAPDATVVGFALNVTVGAGKMLTVTLRDVLPPVPVHSSEKSLF